MPTAPTADASPEGKPPLAQASPTPPVVVPRKDAPGEKTPPPPQKPVEKSPQATPPDKEAEKSLPPVAAKKEAGQEPSKDTPSAEKAPAQENGQGKKSTDFSLRDLLRIMLKYDASDLHIKAGSPPVLRINGELFPVGKKKLEPVKCLDLVFSICTRHQQNMLATGREVEFAFVDKGIRFRINAFLQKSTVSCSIRLIKSNIPSFDDLSLPPVLKKLSLTRQGLILVTGPAGCGKSTTLASMIDYINQNLHQHIITVEDPIEYVHSHKKSIITQREVGSDTESFISGLKYCLRQDPNVILIGEMRDPESIMIAAQAAETGHMVMSTLHTPNSIQSVSRIIDVFSGDSQKQIRLLLANNLRAVVSQRLIPRMDKEGRIPAVEVMIVTPTIASLILEENLNDIYRFISEGKTDGMQTMNLSLTRLVKSGKISRQSALENSDQSTELRMMIDGHVIESLTATRDESLMSWL